MNSGPPLYYDYLNAVNGTTMPSTVHVTNTALSAYFRRYLLQKIMSVFTWTLPDTWAADYFKYVLYVYGYIAVVNTDLYGVICQQCGLRGYDIFYRPTNAVIANPLIRNTLEPRIGRQCTLIKLQPDYGSVMDLVNYYSDLFALLATGVGVTALNSKNNYVFAAQNPQIAESIKKMYDKLASGEPAVVVNKKLFDESTGKLNMEMFGGGSQSTIINDLLLAMTTIENMCDRDIGLPVMPSNNKERDIAGEVRNNNVNSTSLVSMWLAELQKSCAQTREMFGIDIDVDWRSPPETGGAVNEG